MTTDQSCTCPACGSVLPPPATSRGRTRRYCDRACQQSAYRARHTDVPDTHARLDDLLTAVTVCQAALDDPAALAAAADTTLTAARALARAARRQTAEQTVTPARVTTFRPPATPTRPETPTPTPVPGPDRTGISAATTADAPSSPPHLPACPAPGQRLDDLGDGYQLQPPPEQSGRWQLFLHGVNIGCIERTTTGTGRTRRWMAYTRTGLAITNAAGPNGVYKTRRDALIGVAAHHQTLADQRARSQRHLSRRPSATPPQESSRTPV